MRVPMGDIAADALGHIQLIVQINDWSLRTLAPVEMKTGFGWIQAKPACSMAPFAVTPDALGDALARRARPTCPARRLERRARSARANGGAMGFGFHELVAHAARTRSLVRRHDHRLGHRLQRELPRGRVVAASPSVAAIEMIDRRRAARPRSWRSATACGWKRALPDGAPPFGVIDQRVVRA